MPPRFRLRRSALFMPGDSAKAHRKARSLDADVVILDLEDATAPANKLEARQQVVSTLNEGGFGDRELVVRINGLDTAWGHDDLDALAKLTFDGILLPKVESVTQVEELQEQLCTLGFAEDLRVWCMIETPRGVLRADSIADTVGRLECLVVGTSDLTKALGARHTLDRIPLLASLSQCVLAARASGLSVLDGVHLDIQDDGGFLSTCQMGRALGFDGRTLIHPRQIEPCNRVYSPSSDEVSEARRVVEAFGSGTRLGRGVAVLDGRLIEQLHADQAARLLALAELVDARDSRAKEMNRE